MRILVTGASGQLGSYLLRELRKQDLPVVAWSGTRRGEIFGYPLQSIDLADRDRVASAFRDARPTLVIHAAGVTTIADCFRDPEHARQVNVQGTALLAELAEQAKTRLVYLSTDLVFDGERGWYAEGDPVAPISLYGRTKAAAEQAALAYAGTAVLRVSLLFGPSLVERPTFFDRQRTLLLAGKPVELFEDEWRTSLGLAVAAPGLLSVARSDYQGVLHLGGPERLSRLEMGRRLAAFLGCDPSLVVATSRTSASMSEPRPRDVSLDSSKWRKLFPGASHPMFDQALVLN